MFHVCLHNQVKVRKGENQHGGHRNRLYCSAAKRKKTTEKSIAISRKNQNWITSHTYIISPIQLKNLAALESVLWSGEAVVAVSQVTHAFLALHGKQQENKMAAREDVKM